MQVRGGEWLRDAAGGVGDLEERQEDRTLGGLGAGKGANICYLCK